MSSFKTINATIIVEVFEMRKCMHLLCPDFKGGLHPRPKMGPKKAHEPGLVLWLA